MRVAAVERREPVDDARMRARRARGPPRPHGAARSTSASDHFTLKFARCRQSVWSTRKPSRRSPSSTCPSLRWIVTQSPKWPGSMITSQTCSGGTAISVEAFTDRHRAASSSVRSQSRSARSTAASKPCRWTPNAAGGAIVAREQVVLERLHQRLDQRRVLAGDRGGDDRGDRGEREAESQRGPADHQRVGDARDHRRVGHHVRAGDVPGPAGTARVGAVAARAR